MRFRWHYGAGLLMAILLCLTYAPLDAEATGYTIATFALSPDGTMLATAGSSIDDPSNPDKKAYPIDLFNAETGAYIKRLEQVWPMPDTMAFNGDHSLIAYSASIGIASVIDVAADQMMINFFGYGMLPSLGVGWALESDRVAALRPDIVVIEDPRTQTEGASIFPPNLKSTFVSLAWNPDNVTLATVTRDRHIQLWDTTLPDPTLLKSFAGGDGFNLEWHPDGQLLAVSSDTNVEIIDSKTGLVVSTLQLGKNIYALAWSQNGTQLAVCSGRTVTVFDSASHLALATYPTTCAAEHLAWNSSGNLLYADGATLYKDGEPLLTTDAA